jgi:hypothetical protein
MKRTPVTFDAQGLVPRVGSVEKKYLEKYPI